MKKRHLQFDYFLAIATGVLLVLGVLILTSVSAGFSQEKFGRTTYYLFHQILYGLIPGLVLGFVAFKIKISFFQKSAWFLMLLTLILMTAVFVPGLGIISGGAPRWLNLGFVTLQPSEFLKLSFIIYLSAWLAKRADKRTPLLLPFLAVLGIIVVLLGFQSDLGTLVVIITSALLMFFLSNSSIWHNILLLLICGGGLLALIKFAPYRMKRILVFLNPSLDPMGIGYQINQILIAIGSGGISGLGLGMSSQRFGFIPQTMADSIFAIFAEETGFIGSLVLICLFLFFFWASLRIAKKSKDKFSKLLVMGISCWICIQAFINIGAMIGLLPLTGIPLPFISYGGSHLVSELIAVAIVLNISKSNKK